VDPRSCSGGVLTWQWLPVRRPAVAALAKPAPD
jgi:hypothetical protein